MSDETKRRIKTAGGAKPGDSRADITETDRDPKTEKAQHCIDLVATAGMLSKPQAEVEYMGSAVVHYYRNTKFAGYHEYLCVDQVSFGEALHEAHADIGLKALKTRMMAQFGRKPAKQVDR